MYVTQVRRILKVGMSRQAGGGGDSYDLSEPEGKS
jgi:hypothetical protein